MTARETPEERARKAREAWRRSLNGHAREPVGSLCSEVEPEAVTWLWPGRLAEGKITILDGNPGLGKSSATLDIAARISRGDVLPGGYDRVGPRGVVLLSAEDGLADTIVPRLLAAGADAARVFAMTGVKAPDDAEQGVTVPDELAAVEAAITRMDAALLVVDPLVAYLPQTTNANKDQDVRRALAPLAAMLERTNCAGVLVRHLNKTQSSDAISRGGGSIGIIGAARFGLLVARDPDNDDARVMASTKCNIGPEPPALRYWLASVPGTDVARVVWDMAQVHYAAHDLLEIANDEGERTERDEAAAWLADYLAVGPKPADTVFREARKAGHSDKTLRRAKKAIGVRSTKDGFGYSGQWVWAYTGHDIAKAPEGAHVSNVATLDHLRQSEAILDDKPHIITQHNTKKKLDVEPKVATDPPKAPKMATFEDIGALGHLSDPIVQEAKRLATLNDDEIAAYRAHPLIPEALKLFDVYRIAHGGD